MSPCRNEGTRASVIPSGKARCHLDTFLSFDINARGRQNCHHEKECKDSNGGLFLFF